MPILKKKKRDEIDDDLFIEFEETDSTPDRIEMTLIQILRELKKLNKGK